MMHAAILAFTCLQGLMTTSLAAGGFLQGSVKAVDQGGLIVFTTAGSAMRFSYYDQAGAGVSCTDKKTCIGTVSGTCGGEGNCGQIFRKAIANNGPYDWTFADQYPEMEMMDGFTADVDVNKLCNDSKDGCTSGKYGSTICLVTSAYIPTCQQAMKGMMFGDALCAFVASPGKNCDMPDLSLLSLAVVDQGGLSVFTTAGSAMQFNYYNQAGNGVNCTDKKTCIGVVHGSCGAEGNCGQIFRKATANNGPYHWTFADEYPKMELMDGFTADVDINKLCKDSKDSCTSGKYGSTICLVTSAYIPTCQKAMKGTMFGADVCAFVAAPGKNCDMPDGPDLSLVSLTVVDQGGLTVFTTAGSAMQFNYYDQAGNGVNCTDKKTCIGMVHGICGGEGNCGQIFRKAIANNGPYDWTFADEYPKMELIDGFTADVDVNKLCKDGKDGCTSGKYGSTICLVTSAYIPSCQQAMKGMMFGDDLCAFVAAPGKNCDMPDISV